MNDVNKPFDENPMEKYLNKPGGRLPVLAIIRGIVGAIIGGVVGHFAFEWIVTQGLYALVLPGALLGLGFGLASQHSSVICGVGCAIAAFFLGCFSEWNSFPFIDDASFGYFLTHLHLLKPITLIFIVLGSATGFWFGRGR